MKKLKLFIVVAGLLVAGSVSAQMKIGYINLDNVVALMPETKKIIDTLLPKFQVDSLNPQLTYYVSEYQRKDSILRADSITKKLPEQVKSQMRGEMDEYANIVQNWQQYVQQVLEGKRDQMLGPVYQKVYDAVKTVAKEKGYTHVLTKDAFLVAPDTDDMLIMVATKLKLKLPPQLQQGANAPAGTKPAGN
ncbi:MAG TPA: OmpH family outer membrane protein [Chitinophagaceae bacterium]